MTLKSASANVATEKQDILVGAFDAEDVPSTGVTIVFDDELQPGQMMVLIDRIRDRINELDGK